MFCAIVTTIERCKTEGVVDVFQVVKALRVQKPGAVLTVVGFSSSLACLQASNTDIFSPQAQYHLLFETVLEYLESFDTYHNFSDWINQ